MAELSSYLASKWLSLPLLAIHKQFSLSPEQSKEQRIVWQKKLWQKKEGDEKEIDSTRKSHRTSGGARGEFEIYDWAIKD